MDPNYPQYRLELLKKIGLFDSFMRFPETNWEQNYHLLKQFITEFNCFPKSNEEYQGVNIGNWYFSQKQNMKNPDYSKEHREKMCILGVSQCSFNKEHWQNNYQILREFVNEYKRLPKVKEEYQGVKIGLWCLHQKERANKSSDYPEEYFKPLSEIGLFDFKSSIKKQWSRKDDLWNEKYQLLVEFITENHRAPHSREVYNNVHLGSWCNDQKKLLKLPDYPLERREKLYAVGITESINKNEVWENHLQELLAFIKEFERFPYIKETYNGFGIGIWWHKTKISANTFDYPKERIEKLIECGLWPMKDNW